MSEWLVLKTLLLPKVVLKERCSGQYPGVGAHHRARIRKDTIRAMGCSLTLGRGKVLPSCCYSVAKSSHPLSLSAPCALHLSQYQDLFQ